jgi:2-haloacid dehalogenase
LDKYFKKIYISEEVGFAKPDKRFFHLVLDDLGIEPNKALIVGDSIKDDYNCSHEIGMISILLDRFNKNDNFNGPRITSLFELLILFHK